MILEGNVRGFGAELARHLMNPRDNDHVTVHAVEGFVADDLFGAFAEAEAISQATQCRKYLFSLSLNPPPDAKVSIEAFEEAIVAAEKKLGLTGQPRAIVFHEKNGRRHAHCVWSRIDAVDLKAIQVPHYKLKLGDVSRILYRQHDWTMPEGFREAAKRDELNFSRQEAGQAKRAELHPKTQKAMFQRCWEVSDSRAAFAAALRENGYLLARGERRGFVAVDAGGKIWSLSRWCGVKPRELHRRLGPESELPSIEVALREVGTLPRLNKQAPDPTVTPSRAKLIARQREERSALLERQEARRVQELEARSARLPTGLRGAFLPVTGRYNDVLRELEAASEASACRDRDEQQQLIQTHLAERRVLQNRQRNAGLAEGFQRTAASDPRQILVDATDDLSLSREQLLQNPALILAHVSATKARFERADVLRALARQIEDPFELKDAADRAMASPKLIRLDNTSRPAFTTRDFRDAELQLTNVAGRLAGDGNFRIGKQHIRSAIASQDALMKNAFGGRLSDEQRHALGHILGDEQFSMVVGLAGAGKSTLLATAMDAWRRQGVKVHGAALAGKAADGLEDASGIRSRTLASLEMSWENGYTPIAKGDVLVVDEAGMIGTRQLGRITQKIEEIEAKLILVGDADQLQPIEAGTPFRDLVKTHNAAHLTEIHRQRENWQKQASRDLAAGRIGEAVNSYRKQGAVTLGDDAFEALVESYVMDAAANGGNTTRLAFAHKRKDVHALNQAIRAALRPGKEPAIDSLLDTEAGPRAFAEGDRVVFGRNDRELGVKNGMLGTVQSLSASQIVVALDGDPPREVSFDPSRYRSFDHGYAVTIHKSQGATVDRSYVLASRSMDRHLAYVAMTRHRSSMELFIQTRDRPYWAQAMHNRTLERSGPQRSGPSMG
ncbi:MAG: AAA family ATPase [Pseudomonadota bacterium]